MLTDLVSQTSTTCPCSCIAQRCTAVLRGLRTRTTAECQTRKCRRCCHSILKDATKSSHLIHEVQTGTLEGKDRRRTQQKWSKQRGQQFAQIGSHSAGMADGPARGHRFHLELAILHAAMHWQSVSDNKPVQIRQSF